VPAAPIGEGQLDESDVDIPSRRLLGSGIKMGVICKTQKQSKRLHDALIADAIDVSRLAKLPTAFVRGVVVCTALLAKELELDHILVPRANDDNYVSAQDRNVLYVACMRAMHPLTLTPGGTPTRFATGQHFDASLADGAQLPAELAAVLQNLTPALKTALIVTTISVAAIAMGCGSFAHGLKVAIRFPGC